MKTRTSKILTSLVMALFVASAAYSEDNSRIPIYMCYNNVPYTNGIRIPNRAPCSIVLPLDLSYDISTNQLVFYSEQKQNCYYNITDTNSVSVAEGNLDFNEQEYFFVNLDTDLSGEYKVTILYEGCEFIGTLSMP